MANSKNNPVQNTDGKINLSDLLSAPRPITAETPKKVVSESLLGTINREVTIVIPAKTLNVYKSAAGNLYIKHPNKYGLAPMTLVDTDGEAPDQTMELGISMSMPRVHGEVIEVEKFNLDSLLEIFGIVEVDSKS